MVVAVATGAPLLERAHELEALSGAFAEAADHRRGALVLVTGEAGIGKTALLESLRTSLDPRTRVLWAACDPLFTPRPLGPLLDLGDSAGRELGELVAQGARPHDVAAALLRYLDGGTPTLLVLEDVHWADVATLDVMRLVGRRATSVPVLFVATYRDNELSDGHPLRVAIGELPGALRIELEPLSRDAVGELAGPAAVDPSELYERTAGNPFFVTEVIAAGTDRVPATVRDAVLARAARLGPSAREVLDAVAAVPGRAEPWLIEAMLGGPPAGLDECRTSGMLAAEPTGISFRHELARLAVGDAAPADRMAAVHQRALGALAAPPAGAPDLARLAHHAEAAGDAVAVLRYAPAAAAHAMALGAPLQAQEQYARALRFSDALDPGDRAELLEGLADTSSQTDNRIEGYHAVTEAIAIRAADGDDLRQGDDLRLRARLLSCFGRLAESKTDALAAITILERLPPGRELAMALGAACSAEDGAGNTSAALGAGRRAVEVAEDAGDAGALATALIGVGVIELLRGDAGGREKLERGRAIAAEAGATREVARADHKLCWALVLRGEVGTVREMLVPGLEFCRERGMDGWARRLLALSGRADVAAGDFHRAAETAQALIDRPSFDVGIEMDGALILGLTRARRGDPGAWPLLDRAREIAESIGDISFLAIVAAARAEARWLDGRPEDIAGETDELMPAVRRTGYPDLVCTLATWRRRAGLTEELPDAAAGPHRLAWAGDHGAASDAWRQWGARYNAALALADSGDPGLLRLAREDLTALAARPAALIAERRLRALGETVPRGPQTRTRENPAGLTTRQLEVLALLGEGLRNAEIAERLVLSEKTVGHHVSAILGKLGVASRAGAAAAAARLQLGE